MTKQDSIRIDTDVSIDQNDPERVTVTEYTRRGFSVLFRGTHAACANFVLRARGVETKAACNNT
jgi:hypothetical protein